MKKRLLSALLALCMMLTMMPTVAFAAEGDETTADSPASRGGGVVYSINPDTSVKKAHDTLDEAVSAVADNGTIELWGDVTTTGLNLSKNITIQGADGLAEKPTITFANEGIHAVDCQLTFENCAIDMDISENPSGSGGTANLIDDSDLTFIGTDVTIDNDNADKDGESAIYLYQGSNLYIQNGSHVTISGFNNTSNDSGIFADGSERDDNLPHFQIAISGNSALDISNCGWGGMTINPCDLTVSDQSTLTITDCGANGGKQGLGCYYGKLTIEKSSKVDVSNNAGKDWGIFVKDLSVDGTSTLIADNNAGTSDGIDIGGTGVIESGATVKASGNADAGLRVYKSGTWIGDVTIKNGANVTLHKNGAAGISNNNLLTIEEGANVTIQENEVSGIRNNATATINGNVSIVNNKYSGIYNNGGILTINAGTIMYNTTTGYGGGIYNSGTTNISDNVAIYNNHADTAGDDIFNRDGATITFPAVGDGWQLDGDPDCTDAIDGWYDDSEGARWEAHTAPYHAEEFVQFERNGIATVSGLTALKAAHGVDPIDPGEPGGSTWETSKSKTATNLDSNDESEVTLSLPAADYERTMDVVFVIDDTHAGSGIFKESVSALLNELSSKQNLDIHVGVVAFDAVARDWLSATSSGEYSGLVSLKDTGALQALKTAIGTELAYENEGFTKKIGGTNTEWPIAMAQEMLEAGSGSEKHVIMFSDMYGYVYRGELSVNGTTYKNVPLSKCLTNYDLGQLTISKPLYSSWTDVYNGKSSDNDLHDGFFRYRSNGDTASWDNYWPIFQNVNPAPAIPDTEDIAHMPWGEPAFTPFEKSSCLTYERMLGLVANGVQVTIVNNDFDPGSTDIQKIKNEMLNDLAENGITLIREDTANGAPFSSEQMDKVFAALEDKLIQVVDAGSKVVDVIGEGMDNHGNEYNFDFANNIDKLILTVDGVVQTATQLVDPQFSDPHVTSAYAFGEADGTGIYPFVLNYYANGEDGQSDECFVWDINVPVTKEAPVQLTYTVKLTNPQSEEGIYGQYDADGSEDYDGLYTNNRATLYPVDSNGDKGLPENFAKPTVSYTAGAVKLEVQDITVYTGGDGADGVVDDDASDASDESEVEGGESTGLPTPGYTLVLPNDVNEKLADLIDQSEDAVSNGHVDLSEYLTFTYSDGTETRNWPLAVYEEGSYDGINSTLPDGRYVYRIEPATVEGKEIPIRLEFHALDDNGDPIGDPIISDDFDANATNLYDKYSMTIYAGALEQDLVKANLTIGDDTYAFDVEIVSGTLTVRGVEDNSANHPVQDNHEAVSDNTNAVDRGTTVTAVDSNTADTTYYINEDESVTVDPDNVHLLADSTLENDTPLKDYLLEKDHADSGSEIQLLYLDLVDNSNGNAVVVPSQPLDIYWKIPNDANVNGDFRLVHFKGLDREYDGAELDEILDSEQLPSDETGGTSEALTFPVFTTVEDEHGVLDKVQIDGAWYLRFATQDFSPFALIYDRQNGGSNPGGGGNDKPDDLNTEDHFAYIIGYPKDYRTGEPTDDESLWPVEPQGDITRAEVATIFFRMLTDDARSENWSQTNSYTDVASTDWYNNAISTLSNMGIISGDPSGAFRPDDSITRAEFTKIAVGFFDKAGDYVDGTYDDVSSSDWYADFIDAAVDLGLIEGYPDGTIRPEATITRAEACTIVNRTLGRVPDKDHLLPADEMRVWPDNSDTNEWYYAQIQEATNSHDYEWIGEENDQIENWTEKLEDRDWAQLEREWSDANSAPGGEVVD